MMVENSCPWLIFLKNNMYYIGTCFHVLVNKIIWCNIDIVILSKKVLLCLLKLACLLNFGLIHLSMFPSCLIDYQPRFWMLSPFSTTIWKTTLSYSPKSFWELVLSLPLWKCFSFIFLFTCGTSNSYNCFLFSYPCFDTIS